MIYHPPAVEHVEAINDPLVVGTSQKGSACVTFTVADDEGEDR